MSRRRNARRPRRLQVQFWKRGETQAYPGYTTNISITGMFLATNSPQPPGTRLRVEILEGERGFVAEGVVAHARKTRGDMTRISQPGMGIRFLPVEELVRELIPVAPGEMEEIPDTFHSPSRPQIQASPASPHSSPPPLPPSPAARAPQAPSEPPVSIAPTPLPRASRPAEGTGTFSVHFLSPEEFLEVYRRDIANGGLFVSTRYPGRLQETVGIDLYPPIAGAPPITLRARVVQRFEPHGDDLKANLLAGMGVEILDLPAVMEKLGPVVQALA